MHICLYRTVLAHSRQPICKHGPLELLSSPDTVFLIVSAVVAGVLSAATEVVAFAGRKKGLLPNIILFSITSVVASGTMVFS